VETGRSVGRYRIDERLASGAMGEVYRAYDPVIDRKVAIKVIRRELVGGADGAQWLERFKREARAAGQRFHPNIVTVLDYGEEDGLPFLAMELVDGPSLAGLLKSAGPLPPARAAEIITEVLAGLGFAHQNGIIHRDIKPSNVLVPADGPVKIADFGIARTESSDLTVVGDVLGTPAYVAPEQLRGDPVDSRSDLFAAGVMLFEALCGVKPFRAKSLPESLALMKNRGPEDVCALNPLVPGALQPVIDRALAFDPAQRFASAGEFAVAIGTAMVPDRRAEAAQTTGPMPATAAPSPPDQPVWGAELLQRIERELAVLIGPVASLAVKRAARSSGDLGGLCEALSRYIDNESDRRQFLEAGRSLAVRMPDQTGSSAMMRSLGTAEATTSGISMPLPPLPLLADLETRLTRIIGPIARIVLKRHLRNFETLPQLHQALAADIPNERDRAAFLESLKSE
jgi:eukaryotic-like serine/threonine-protein kinase